MIKLRDIFLCAIVILDRFKPQNNIKKDKCLRKKEGGRANKWENVLFVVSMDCS